MKLEVAFRRLAAAELGEVRDWYETQEPGLGAEFTTAVSDTVDFIAEMPEAYQIVDPAKGIRRALTRRFPYAVYYIIEPPRVVVLAVLHVARDPATWKRRG